MVAEGIETVEELEAVIASGARFGQGYLLARPAFPLPEVTWPAELGGGPVGGDRRRAHKPTFKPRTTTRTRRR